MAARPDPKPIAVKVHPINVGQGDAILLEIQYDDIDETKRYLIDGGQGQKSIQGLFKSLKTALKQNHCIAEIKNDKHHDQIKLDLIVNTHPDNDHCGGINRLLNDEKLTVCCPIITTSAASLTYYSYELKKNKIIKKDKIKDHDGEEYTSTKGEDCPYFCFPQDTSEGKNTGKKHIGFKSFPERPILEICGNREKRFDYNATSILTIVQIPGSKYDYDVVLTGDSYGGIILDTLGLRSEGTTRKNVGVFQVPHHGSKGNSTKKRTNGGSSTTTQQCKEFYTVFDADIYLISHGDNQRYKHPNKEVITGILAAAVEKKQHCKIVVTTAWFDGTKIEDTVGNWEEYVDIYHFTPCVTLNPNDVKLLEGLQLYKTTNTSEASPETPPKSSEHPPPLANKSRRELFFTVYKTRVPPTDVVSGTSGGESQPSTFAIQSTMPAHISVNSKKRKWVQYQHETENGEENRRPFKKLAKEKCPSSRVCREKVSKTTGGYTCKVSLESSEELPDTFVKKLRKFFRDNQPANCSVQSRLNTITTDDSETPDSESQQDQENFSGHPRGYQHNPEVPVLRGLNHCQYCLCAPCVTQLRPDFLQGYCDPHPANDETRHKLYKMFVRSLSDLRVWVDDKYLENVSDKRKIIPKCVVREIRSRYPSHDGIYIKYSYQDNRSTFEAETDYL